MPPVEGIGSGRVLILGAARSGLAAAAAIRRVRPDVAVRLTDRIAVAGDVPDGVELALGDEDVSLLAGVELVVKSPGVPGEAPLVTTARARGLPVWAEVELAYHLLGGRNPIVGVTGTNGKTTTAALCGAMLERGGVEATVAGNIGTAMSTLVGRIDPGRHIVCELSSFQLEDVDSFHAETAIVLNVTPDHLDRHGTLEAYATAKLRLLERQSADDVAVINDDDAWLAARHDDALPGEARRLRVRRDGAAADLLAAFDESALAGSHNLENALCAAVAAVSRGARRDGVVDALRSFQPLQNRLEQVAVIGGVRYVNDSKATNVEAAVRAIGAFDDGVHLIAGGSLKGGSFAALAGAVDHHVRAVYLIGDAADQLAAALAQTGVTLVHSGTLERAMDDAAAAAQPGDTILLAPACASFDQFRDYSDRGDAFRRLAQERTS